MPKSPKISFGIALSRKPNSSGTASSWTAHYNSASMINETTVADQNIIKFSLYSRYYVEACNEQQRQQVYLASGKNQVQNGAISSLQEAGRLRTDLSVIMSSSHPKNYLVMHINSRCSLKF